MLTEPQLAVLVSGRGTNLAAIIAAGVPVKLVLADKPCPALDIASAAGVRTTIVPRNDYGYHAGVGEQWDRAGFTHQVTAALKDASVTVIAMAGFGTILSPSIYAHYHGHILNTHPALLPNFPGPGSEAIAATLGSGATETGCTVHLATDKVDDATDILGQRKVPILPGDDVQSLWNRIKAAEYELYPSVLQDILFGRIRLKP